MIRSRSTVPQDGRAGRERKRQVQQGFEGKQAVNLTAAPSGPGKRQANGRAARQVCEYVPNIKDRRLRIGRHIGAVERKKANSYEKPERGFTAHSRPRFIFADVLQADCLGSRGSAYES